MQTLVVCIFEWWTYNDVKVLVNVIHECRTSLDTKIDSNFLTCLNVSLEKGPFLIRKLSVVYLDIKNIVISFPSFPSNSRNDNQGLFAFMWRVRNKWKGIWVCRIIIYT